MSANILWTPVGKGKSLNISAPSSFMTAFVNAFGNFPIILNKSSLERLRGFLAGYSNEESAIKKLIEAVEEHREIEVFVEY